MRQLCLSPSAFPALSGFTLESSSIFIVQTGGESQPFQKKCIKHGDLPGSLEGGGHISCRKARSV